MRPRLPEILADCHARAHDSTRIAEDFHYNLSYHFSNEERSESVNYTTKSMFFMSAAHWKGFRTRRNDVFNSQLLCQNLYNLT